MSVKIQLRDALPYQAADWPDSIPEVVRRVYAARGITSYAAVNKREHKLLHWSLLGGIHDAAKIIAGAIRNQDVITISGDYDCDGCTGASVGYRGLRMLGAKEVYFVVPNRFKHGYGLSPQLVDEMNERTNLIVTVDAGVSSHDGVKRAKELGRKVVITDHHLPGDTLPEADAIVNPNLKGDPFPSKALAGVGVMWYVLLATQAYLLADDPHGKYTAPLSRLLDLVALGTIADLVPLDANNRLIVAIGLNNIRRGVVSAGLAEILTRNNKNLKHVVPSDFGFTVGPRLNAAGRMEDMSIGIATLTSDDPKVVSGLVQMLEDINTERKDLQAEMTEQAEAKILDLPSADMRGVVVFDPSWHSGIVGLVSSKLKEALWRPVIAMAPSEEGSTELRGSARSIPGFHLRDALALVDVRNPGLIPKFGGHAMAAGLSLHIDNVERFSKAFDEVARELLTPEQLTPALHIDGELPAGYFVPEFYTFLQECGPWGQGFPEPMFQNDFEVEDFRVLKEKHLSLNLIDPRDGSKVKGIMFNTTIPELIPSRLRIVYELNLNVWNDRASVQLMIRHIDYGVK